MKAQNRDKLDTLINEPTWRRFLFDYEDEVVEVLRREGYFVRSDFDETPIVIDIWRIKVGSKWDIEEWENATGKQYSRYDKEIQRDFLEWSRRTVERAKEGGSGEKFNSKHGVIYTIYYKLKDGRYER